MQIRKKLTILVAAALPLTGIAVFGGIQAANAGGGPTLQCSTLAGNIDFNNGSGAVYLNAGAGATTELAAAAAAAATTIDVVSTIKTGSVSLLVGQTLTVNGTGPYSIASTATTTDPADTNVTLTSPLVGGAEKVKAAVVVAPTGNVTGETVAYTTNATAEDLTASLSTCGSTATYPGEFGPDQATLSGSSPAGVNAAKALEGTPAPFTLNVTFPSPGPDYTAPIPTVETFPGGKDDALVLTGPNPFTLTEKAGVVTGDYATPKAGYLELDALVGFTVCTEGELAAIDGDADLPGTSTPNPAAAANGGPISPGADPNAVCDGGTSPAYPGASGLSEVLAAETSNTAGTGGDGTPIVAIYDIAVSSPVSGGTADVV